LRFLTLVIETDAKDRRNGFPFWLAKCLYWMDGEPKVTTVPGTNGLKAPRSRLRRLGGGVFYVGIG
jgi:hypothetical protein